MVEPEDGPALTFYDGQVYATSAGASEALDESDQGRQVHRYSGSSDGAAIRDAYARANSFAEVPPPKGALAVEEMQVDFYVDADSGDLLRQPEETRLLLDFAEFGLGAEGVVRLTIAQQRDFADHGGDIVVASPQHPRELVTPIRRAFAQVGVLSQATVSITRTTPKGSGKGSTGA